MLPLQRRLLPIVAVLLGAPITAEMLQAYLPLTGQLGQSLIAMAFLAPLYGGAALLIREVTVRTGQGWTCTLLLAAAFGLAMQGLIDLAMGGQDNPSIPYWSSLRDPTLIPGLGVSVFPTLAWTTGHIMMSVGAPLALLHALAPAHRGKPLLGWLGMSAVLLAGTVIGIQVHIDGRRAFDYIPSFGQVAGVLAVITVILGLALSPLGKATQQAQRSEQLTAELRSPAPRERSIPAALVVTAGATAKVVIDLLPSTWLGVAILVAVLSTLSVALRRCSRARHWGAREVGLLGVGVIIGAILIGLASPLPAGVTPTVKIMQGMVLLGAAVTAMALVLRRTAQPSRAADGPPPPLARQPRRGGR